MSDYWFEVDGNSFLTTDDVVRDKPTGNVHSFVPEYDNGALSRLFDKTQKTHPWITAIEKLEFIWRDNKKQTTLYYFKREFETANLGTFYD